MPSKRSRVLRSSSQGELSVFDRPQSPSVLRDMPRPPVPRKSLRSSPSPAKPSPPPPQPDRPPKSILALASPEHKPPAAPDLKIDSRFGGFLERCRFCKKPLSANENVYMYRSVYAFCTPECRDEQIVLDEERASGKSTKMDLDEHQCDG